MTSLYLAWSDGGPNVVENPDPWEHCTSGSASKDVTDPSSEHGRLAVSHLVGAPLDVLAAAGVTSARLVAVRVLDGGPVTLVLTSATAANQVIRVGDLFVWQGTASRLTGVTVAGVGTIEFFVAGTG